MVEIIEAVGRSLETTWMKLASQSTPLEKVADVEPLPVIEAQQMIASLAYYQRG